MSPNIVPAPRHRYDSPQFRKDSDLKPKHIIIAIAGSFLLLLIIGGIFAIKAEPADESAGSAPTNSANPTTANPLATATQNPSEIPASDADPTSAGYTLLATTDTGSSILTQKPDITTVPSAILAALHDLTHILDSKPQVQGAFADAQQQHRGGATFTGSLKGQPIKGTIICGIGDKGAAITILYAHIDAPIADIAKLTAALSSDNQLQDQSIGDGAGTVSIPPTWKITNSNNLGTVMIDGPDQQKIFLGLGMEIITPDSVAAVAQRQLAEAGQLTPATRMLVAPYTAPLDALKNLMPQLSDMSTNNNGPAFTLDQILQSDTVAAQIPNGQATRIYYASTNTQNNQTIKMRNWAQMECYPIGNGTWAILWSQVSGPDATFDRDLPTMIAISKSWKLNDSVVMEHGNQNVAASNARFAAFEASQKETQDTFDNYLHSIQHNSLLTDRTNTDFDEVIRGYRTIEDTQTGDHASADLGNVNEIVNSLNEHDPGRYIQIPLRDEEFPLNQGQ
jgi:hypothetical protein